MKRSAHAAIAAGVLLLGVLLHLPSLSSGLAADDYLQRAMLDGTYPVARSGLDLYAFVDGAAELRPLVESGTLPWWSTPELRLTALRPLASLSILFDHRVLGRWQWAQHLHSLTWFSLLLFGFGSLARRLLPAPAALLALGVFAWDPAHVMPVGWLANRTALMSATFGVYALWAHLRWREDGWRPGAALSVIGFALAFGAGEYGLCVLAYLLAYELFGASGGRRQRALAALAGLGPGLVYVILHVALGYGAKGSAVYVDPIDHPLKFLVAVVLRPPALAGSELSLMPPEALHAVSLLAGPLGLFVLTALIALFLALVPGAVRRVAPESRRTVIAFGIGALVSLLPLAGTMPTVRLLHIPSIGGSLIVASLLWDGWLAVRARARLRWLRAVVAVGLVVLHVMLAPLITALGSIGWRDLHASVRNMYLTAPIDDARVAEQKLVVVNAREPLSLIYPPYVRASSGHPLPAAWRVLSITHRDELVTRTSDRTLELTVEGGGMLEDPVSQLFRGLEQPLAVGDVVKLPDLRIEVLERADWGPRRVRYELDRSIDHPSVVLLGVHARAIVRLPAPRIGQTIRIQAR